MEYILWLWSDPETMEPVGGPVQMTEDQAQSWYARKVEPGSPADCYRLIINEDNQPVGEVSFHHLDLRTMTANFNIKVAAAERGKGYAKEAMQLFLDYFFHELGGQTMVDDVALSNSSGQQALLRFGFEHDPSQDKVFRLRMSRKRYVDLYGAEYNLESKARHIVPQRKEVS
jgi:RimJ/RimL family protein N-acetyltransferase